MIEVKRIYDRVNNLAKKDQSGYNTADEFNSRLEAVQLRLIELFRPYYDQNEMVAIALSPFAKKGTGTTDVNGILNYSAFTVANKPIHILSAGVALLNSKKSANRIKVNQINHINDNAIRKPDASKQRFRYAVLGESIQFFPEGARSIYYYFLRKPITGKIAFTEVTNSLGDFLNFDSINSVDLEWNDDVFNIICYMMLEELGLEIRETLLVEYGKMGIQEQSLKING